MTRRRGFSLIELLVTIAIIAIMMALAMPSVGRAALTARERGVEQKFIQDFTWARGAAGAADASVLNSSISGAPIVVLTLQSGGTWTTTIQGSAGTVTDSSHSMTTLPSGVTIPCTSVISNGLPALTFPITFTFTSTGFLASTSSGGNVTFTGSSGQAFPLAILQSGSIIQGNSAS